MPAVSGSPTQVATSVTTLSALAGTPDDAFKDGDFAYVESTRATYQMLRSSTAAVSGDAVATFTGNGRWLFFKASDSWGSQATWFIDPTNGSDDNTGLTALTALKTWAEFRRRVSMLAVSMTVTVLEDLTESILGDFYALTTGLTLTIQGTPVVVIDAGAVTTFTDPVRTSGLCAQGTMTSAVIADFTAHVGRFLRSTANAFAPILGVSAGLAPFLPFWANASLSNTKPVNGTRIDVVTMTEVPTIQLSVHDGLIFEIDYFKFTSAAFGDAVSVVSDNPVVSGTFFACDFGGYLNNPNDTYFVACQLSGSGQIYSYLPGSFIGGGSRRTISLLSGGKVSFQGFLIQGGAGLVVGNGSNYAQPSSVGLLGATLGLGVFGSSGVGVTLGSGALLNGTTLYGTSNATYGLTANYGARMQVSVDPTITGTTADLQFCGAGTAIPRLVAGAAVPAAQALTTWANWANAGTFNKRVVDYSNLTSICE